MYFNAFPITFIISQVVAIYVGFNIAIIDLMKDPLSILSIIFLALTILFRIFQGNDYLADDHLS